MRRLSHCGDNSRRQKILGSDRKRRSRALCRLNATASTSGWMDWVERRAQAETQRSKEAETVPADSCHGPFSSAKLSLPHCCHRRLSSPSHSPLASHTQHPTRSQYRSKHELTTGLLSHQKPRVHVSLFEEIPPKGETSWLHRRVLVELLYNTAAT